MLEDFTQLKKLDLDSRYYYDIGILQFLNYIYPNSCIYKYQIHYSSPQYTWPNFTKEFIADYIMKCQHKIIIFSIAVYFGKDLTGKEMHHANFIIYNKDTGIFFKLDPASYTNKVSNDFNLYLKNICAYIRKTHKIKCTFKKSLSTQAFQTILENYLRETKTRENNAKIGLWMPGGFCYACSLLFLHNMLFHPDLTIKQTYDKIGKNPEQLNKLILNYASFVNAINKQEIHKYNINRVIPYFKLVFLKPAHKRRLNSPIRAIKSRVSPQRIINSPQRIINSPQRSRVKRAYRKRTRKQRTSLQKSRVKRAYRRK